MTEGGLDSQRDSDASWRRQVLDFGRGRTRSVDGDLPSLFEAQVEKTPDSVALVTESGPVSWRTLNERANQIAHALVARGVGSGMLVTVVLERSVDWVAALLGVIKTGAPYLPIDPANPVADFAAIVTESASALVLTRAAYEQEFPGSVDCLVLDSPTVLAGFERLPPTNLTDRERLSALDPDHPVSVIFTSGSTGVPKGVEGTVRSLLNRLEWGWREFAFTKGEYGCLKTSPGFVDHLAELWGPLLRGVPLVIVPDQAVNDLRAFVELIARYPIRRILLVPSQLRGILRLEASVLKKLAEVKHVFCSGETLSVGLTRAFFELLPHATLYNVYGATEVTADCTWHPVSQHDVLTYFQPPAETSPAGHELVSWYEVPPRAEITASHTALTDLNEHFGKSEVPLEPLSLKAYKQHLAKDVIPYSVDTNSAKFMGHMTSALPSFMHDFNQLITRLNQNLVKVETSKSLTLLERETLAMLHGTFYQRGDAFYDQARKDPDTALGLFVSGGSLANLTALWCARNRALPAKEGFAGVAEEGMLAALKHHGADSAVILGTRLLHYSVQKSASLLGLGKQQVIAVGQTPNGAMDIEDLKRRLQYCEDHNLCVLAVIGIAGATETGAIDPLPEIAAIAKAKGIHFHVDAAWGAPLFFSQRYRHLLKGIEQADSITMCGHKQFYLPIGVSLCLFRDATVLHAIATSARYQARETTFDSGRWSPEGTRPATSLYFNAALNLFGRRGYGQLVEHGMRNAEYLEKRIQEAEEFELLGTRRINILNFRYVPVEFRGRSKAGDLTVEENARIDEFNIQLQEQQFLEGRGFISRTRVGYPDASSAVEVESLRAVMANPLTNPTTIDQVLRDQLRIAQREFESERGEACDLMAVETVVSAGDEENEGTGLDEGIPIGTPLPNCQIYVLDAEQDLVPPGEIGELYVAGLGLARGYWKQANRTVESFVPDPFVTEPGARMYRTGDMGRWRRDGVLEFLGRADDEVKIAGFRVELGEVETAVAKLPGVAQAVVIAKKRTDGDVAILAYVIATQEQDGMVEACRAQLEATLPYYMVPERIRVVDHFPVTLSGKVDRRALLTMV